VSRCENEWKCRKTVKKPSPTFLKCHTHPKLVGALDFRQVLSKQNKFDATLHLCTNHASPRLPLLPSSPITFIPFSLLSKTLNPDQLYLSVQIPKALSCYSLNLQLPLTTMPSCDALNVLEDVVLRSTVSSSSSTTSLGHNDVVLAVWSAHRRC
jgi:hypothetical protein